MATNFRIRIASGTGEPDEPPFDAWPLVEAPPVVIYPEQKVVNGSNLPAATHGLPYSIFGRNVIGAVGLDYYNDIYGSTTVGSVAVKVKLYDLRSTSWKVYSGNLWRYTVERSVRAGYRFNVFRVMVNDLVETTW